MTSGNLVPDVSNLVSTHEITEHDTRLEKVYF